jgi:predicted dehydrogenase
MLGGYVVRAAVIGTGFIGPVHVEGLRRAGVEVVGVLGSNHAKSQAAAQRLHVARAYANIDELLVDLDVDSVHVTSPNQAHFEQAKLCLKAGKHVLCEKPLAMNSVESRELVRLAAESGRAAGVNYNIRYYPLCIEAAERRKAGQLGKIHHVAGSYAQDWLLLQTDFNWRVLSSESGPLRAVADIGTHWLDLIQSITGLQIESVCADLKTVYEHRLRPIGTTETFSSKIAGVRPSEPVPIDTEDYGAVLLRFAGGARGVMWVSQVNAGKKNTLRWEIAAADQALNWDSENPNQLWIGNREKANEQLTRDPALMLERAARFASYPGGHNEGFPDSFKQLFRDFYGAIEDGSYRTAPAFPTFADGHREILLCEAIFQSSQEDRWVSVAAE